MMDQPSTNSQRLWQIGPLETEIQDVIWRTGWATSREVFEAIRDWAHLLGQSTVLTVLHYSSAPRPGPPRADGHDGHQVYSATITREELGATMIDRIVGGIFCGDVRAAVEYLQERGFGGSDGRRRKEDLSVPGFTKNEPVRTTLARAGSLGLLPPAPGPSECLWARLSCIPLDHVLQAVLYGLGTWRGAIMRRNSCS